MEFDLDQDAFEDESLHPALFSKLLFLNFKLLFVVHFC